MKINHIITKPTESLKNYLPEKDQTVNTVRVQTKNGIGELYILRENQNAYILSFYKMSKATNHLEQIWQSSPLPTSEAIDGSWLLCWARPGGFLP